MKLSGLTGKLWLCCMVVALAALPLLGMFVREAAAATSRVAIIAELSGTVKVKKAGGSKEFTAFARMTLNEGDVLRTEPKSSAALRFGNGTSEDDKMTVAAGTTLTFSKLSNSNGTTTKVSMFNGSVWADVKSVANRNDEFALETPTAVMGVRGTHLLVGVDPATGESTFFIAAGKGEVAKHGSSGTTTLQPFEQLAVNEETPGDDLAAGKNVADLDSLIASTSAEIIEAVVAAKQEIDEENDAYLAALQSGSDAQGGAGVNQEAVDRIRTNLQNLVGNIVNKAIGANVVSQERIQMFIEEVNKQLDRKLDLSQVKDVVLTEEEQAKQRKINEERAEALRKAEERKKQEEEARKGRQELLDKLEQQKRQLEEANRKKAEEQAQKAKAEYANQLSAEEKTRFEAEEKKREEEARANAPAPSPTPTPEPSPEPTPVHIPTAEAIAAQITGIAQPATDQTSLILPTVRSGYSVAIHSSDRTDVVGADGTIAPPAEDTDVSLVLTVTRASDGTTAHTGALTVTVPARTPTAEDIAGKITGVAAPAANGTVLTLPTVPDGYTIAILDSGNADVIGTDGTITPPSSATDVNLTFRVTRTSDGTTADTASLTVTVPAAIPVFIPRPASSVNVALASLSAVTSASSTIEPQFPHQSINDGDRTGMAWGNGGGWNDSTPEVYPDWVQIDFAGSRTINEISVITLVDNFGPQNSVDPTVATTFSAYGITDYVVQYWAGGDVNDWVTVPNGTVTNNNYVWRQFVFEPVETNKIRITISNAKGYSRIIEIEAWSYSDED